MSIFNEELDELIDNLQLNDENSNDYINNLILEYNDITIPDTQLSSNMYWKIGYFYDYKRNYNTAVEFYNKSAELGNSDAMNQLAIYYKTGTRIEKDYNTMIELYNKAIELGNSRAMNELAICYEDGTGVQKNYNKMIELYKQSVKLCNIEAMNNLALCYKNGIGVKVDYNEAIELFNNAIQLGCNAAMRNLIKLKNNSGFIQFVKTDIKCNDILLNIYNKMHNEGVFDLIDKKYLYNKCKLFSDLKHLGFDRFITSKIFKHL
jgi:TPR repeat protein